MYLVTDSDVHKYCVVSYEKKIVMYLPKVPFVYMILSVK